MARILDGVGTALWQMGLDGLGRVVLLQALAMQEAHFGREHPQVIPTLNLLATVLVTMGRLDDALPLLERALGLAEHTFGPGKAGVAHTAAVLAAVLTELGRPAEAIVHLDAALAAYGDAIGGNSEQIASLYGLRGYTLANSGHAEQSLADYARALELIEASLGPDDPAIATQLENQGLALLSLERLEEARASFERALAIRIPRGRDDAQVYYGELGLGEIETKLGHPAVAIPHLEHAVALRTNPDTDPAELADARFSLAKALAAAHRDPARARRLATEARAGFVASGRADDALLGDVDAWLRTH
jgi:tetratricopeptide (TPR) repeat protein